MIIPIRDPQWEIKISFATQLTHWPKCGEACCSNLECLSPYQKWPCIWTIIWWPNLFKWTMHLSPRRSEGQRSTSCWTKNYCRPAPYHIWPNVTLWDSRSPSPVKWALVTKVLPSTAFTLRACRETNVLNNEGHEFGWLEAQIHEWCNVSYEKNVYSEDA